MRKALVTLIFLRFCGSAIAGEADVLEVKMDKRGPDSFWFDVTVKHADTGWDHYADAWDVVAPDGTVLGTRVLAHPHVNEQPFTRSLSGVRIPGEFTWVRVRGHDLVHGLGGREVTLSVPHR